jgi:single-strand DNA-binding protein
VVFYRRLAEVAAEFLKKGSKIYVEGSLRTQQWDKDGEKRYTTVVVAKELQLLDRSNDNEGASGSSSNGKQNTGKPQQNRSASPKSSVTHRGQFQQPPVSANAHALYDADEMEDDIPF